MTVDVGRPAPEFTLPDRDGTPVRLRDLVKERPVVLYFYPKDFTPGCTAESCAFRDAYDDFREAGADVVGVSTDDVDSHQRFAERHGLPFRLLSDVDGRVHRLYGVRSFMGLLPGRVTFVIDQTGIVRHVFSSHMHPTRHVQEALRTIHDLTARAGASSA